MRPSEVLTAVIAKIDAMDVDELTPGAGMRAAAGSARRRRIPGRNTTVIPGGSRRQPRSTGSARWHEMQLSIMTYYPVSDDVLSTAADDQADMADALETLTGGDILQVTIDLGGPGDSTSQSEVMFNRIITVVFRKT